MKNEELSLATLKQEALDITMVDNPNNFVLFSKEESHIFPWYEIIHIWMEEEDSDRIYMEFRRHLVILQGNKLNALFELFIFQQVARISIPKELDKTKIYVNVFSVLTHEEHEAREKANQDSLDKFENHTLIGFDEDEDEDEDEDDEE